jgi:hypothetical protein
LAGREHTKQGGGARLVGPRAGRRIDPALREVIASNDVDAITVHCFDFLGSIETSGCLALAQLNDDGMVAGCKSDVLAVLAMLWARHLLDQVGWTPNHASVDQEHNAVTTEALYDAVTTFIAAYLVHMEVEELQVMPVIQNGAPIEKLMAVQMAIRTSVLPLHMSVFLRCMLPAMNPEERTAMLAGMKMGAPPKIFAMFWETAESRLSSNEQEPSVRCGAIASSAVQESNAST